MTKKILIIEDDEFLRNLMVRRLVKEGFEVVEQDWKSQKPKSPI